MQKLNKHDGYSKDIQSKNIEKLKLLFPEVFAEGKIDFPALKEVLGEYVEDKEERYRFTWNGKSKARRIAQTPSTGTLRPAPEEPVNWESTQNLFIEGDNLEVLKLLQKSYHKQVKMIYIDPPYNTGGDFIYKVDEGNLGSSLLDLVNNIKSDRTEQDVLYEILLKYGLNLTIPIEERTLEGKKIFIIGAGILIICLDEKITLEVVEAIAKLKDELQPEMMRVVFKDGGFKTDVVKTNAVQILRQNGIEDVRSL